jgi:hypothetical protein
MKNPFTAEMLQDELKVNLTGKWDEATEHAMREALGFPVDDTGKPWGDQRLIIGFQQKMMREAGITVDIDGIVGPRTESAFIQYDSLKKFPPEKQALFASASAGWWDYSWIWRRRPAPTLVPIETEQVEVQPTTPKPVAPIKSSWPRQADVPDFFGEVGSDQVIVMCPWQMFLSWDMKTPTRKISLHRKVAPSAQRALDAIWRHYGQEGIEKLGLHRYGGSLNVRKIRGGNSYSMHSWGIAIDWDPDRNQLAWNHIKARLAASDAEKFWECWEAEGWISLGRERDFDWMHVQAARL